MVHPAVSYQVGKPLKITGQLDLTWSCDVWDVFSWWIMTVWEWPNGLEDFVPWRQQTRQWSFRVVSRYGGHVFSMDCYCLRLSTVFRHGGCKPVVVFFTCFLRRTRCFAIVWNCPVNSSHWIPHSSRWQVPRPSRNAPRALRYLLIYCFWVDICLIAETNIETCFSSSRRLKACRHYRFRVRKPMVLKPYPCYWLPENSDLRHRTQYYSVFGSKPGTFWLDTGF